MSARCHEHVLDTFGCWASSLFAGVEVRALKGRVTGSSDQPDTYHWPDLGFYSAAMTDEPRRKKQIPAWLVGFLIALVAAIVGALVFQELGFGDNPVLEGLRLPEPETHWN